MEDFIHELIKQLVPIILVVFVIPVLLKIRTAVTTYIEKNVNSEILDCAKQIWNIVEEDFRLNEKAKKELHSKADMFDEMLIKKFPYLTKEDLKYFRQSVAGEINKNKGKNTTEIDIKKKIEELEKELNGLKASIHKDESVLKDIVVDK